MAFHCPSSRRGSQGRSRRGWGSKVPNGFGRGEGEMVPDILAPRSGMRHTLLSQHISPSSNVPLTPLYPTIACVSLVARLVGSQSATHIPLHALTLFLLRVSRCFHVTILLLYVFLVTTNFHGSALPPI
jgi:hypothetical protein